MQSDSVGARNTAAIRLLPLVPSLLACCSADPDMLRAAAWMALTAMRVFPVPVCVIHKPRSAKDERVGVGEDNS